MSKLDLLRIGDELYEIVRKIPITSFKRPLTGEDAEIAKQWVRCDKILISKNTNEYVFVNTVDDLEIIE